MNEQQRRHRRQAEIFAAVTAMPEDARTAELDRLCGEDDALRGEVEDLLRRSRDDDFLADTQLDQAPALPNAVPFHPHPAGRIAGYRVRELLGEGGMGSVYMAEQERPQREVAIKVIRAGLADESMRRRFYREAEALGRLKHPGIAQVYEVGIDEGSGVPFIAMELVEGRSLTAFADLHGLGIREKLKLAIRVCEAVEHAHQRGVIHRDLKPANILVNADGHPKVLDFGVARMTENDLNVVTLQTQAGQVIGTASYMSPEQAGGDPDLVDTRSDVYSLGVVIFELLAGRLPILVDGLPLPDAVRAIREAEPTRIATLDTSLRGDVDTILATALEGDPERRYQTASELAAEIRRHLADEPIIAHPPSTIYQIRKFARRNKALVGGAVAVSAAVVLGFGATGVSLVREASAHNRAEVSLERAGESSAFLRDVLLGLDPSMAAGRDTELLTLMLDRAEDRLEDEITTPAVRAEALTTIGRVRYVVFDYPEAASLLDRAYEAFRTLQADDPALMNESRLIHADAHYKAGDRERARELLLQAIDAYQDEAWRPDLAQATRQLGEIVMEDGNAAQALELYTRSLALSEDSSAAERGRVLLLIGMAQRRLRDFDASQASYEQATRLFDNEDTQIELGMAQSALGRLASDRGDIEAAIQYYQLGLETRMAVDPRPNPQVAIGLSNVGRMLVRSERFDEALPVLQHSLDMHVEINGADHHTVGFPSVTLGEALSGLGRHNEAMPHIDRGVELIDSYFGAASHAGVSMRSRRITCLAAAGNLNGVVEHAERLLVLIEQAGINSTNLSLPVLRHLADAHADLGNLEAAKSTILQALSVAPDDQTADLQARLDRLER